MREADWILWRWAMASCFSSGDTEHHQIAASADDRFSGEIAAERGPVGAAD
jgi:hypothetical protein